MYRLVMPGRQRREEQERLLEQQRQAEEAKKKKSRRTQVQEPAAPPLPPPIPEVRIHQENTLIGDYVVSRLGSFYQALLMASFVPFLVYFMLSWRDHIHRSFLQFFQGEDRVVAAKSLEGIAGMVRAFVVGNFVLGLLLAFFSATIFWLLRLPYPLLVGPLSGFLSLIPYIGLPLAMIPPFFVALGTPTSVSGYILLGSLVASLHLLALNLFYPKIVGSRVHLNPLVVTFALMFWGFLWDAAGLLLAIPMTAAVKAVCDNVRGLRPFGKFLGD
jgi:predicted PurR-regulated permease PerM